MRAINTIPREEYAERLFEAMRRMNKKIVRLESEEDSLYMKACDKGDEEQELKHWFNREALGWAGLSITLSPHMILERIKERRCYSEKRRPLADEETDDCKPKDNEYEKRNQVQRKESEGGRPAGALD